MSVIASIGTNTTKITNNVKNKEVKKKLIEKEVGNNSNIMNLVTNSKFITSLAAASYIKIDDNGQIVNNIVTANEFLENHLTNNIITDIDFSQKLIEMLAEALPQEKNNQNKNKGQAKTRKK